MQGGEGRHPPSRKGRPNVLGHLETLVSERLKSAEQILADAESTKAQQALSPVSKCTREVCMYIKLIYVSKSDRVFGFPPALGLASRLVRFLNDSFFVWNTLCFLWS